MKRERGDEGSGPLSRFEVGRDWLCSLCLSCILWNPQPPGTNRESSVNLLNELISQGRKLAHREVGKPCSVLLHISIL